MLAVGLHAFGRAGNGKHRDYVMCLIVDRGGEAACPHHALIGRAGDAFPADPALSVALDGEWGPYSADAVVPIPQPLEILTPPPEGILSLAGTEATLTWTPASSSSLLLHLQGPELQRVYRLVDDGSFTLDTTGFPALGEGEVYTLDLVRSVQTEHDVRGHTFATRHCQFADDTAEIENPCTHAGRVCQRVFRHHLPVRQLPEGV